MITVLTITAEIDTVDRNGNEGLQDGIHEKKILQQNAYQQFSEVLPSKAILPQKNGVCNRHDRDILPPFNSNADNDTERIYSSVDEIQQRKLTTNIINLQIDLEDEHDANILPKLLEMLQSEKVLVTFFFTTDFMQAYPEAITTIMDDGHSIGLLITEDISLMSYERQETFMAQKLAVLTEVTSFPSEKIVKHIKIKLLTQNADTYLLMKKMDVQYLTSQFNDPALCEINDGELQGSCGYCQALKGKITHVYPTVYGFWAVPVSSISMSSEGSEDKIVPLMQEEIAGTFFDTVYQTYKTTVATQEHVALRFITASLKASEAITEKEEFHELTVNVRASGGLIKPFQEGLLLSDEQNDISSLNITGGPRGICGSQNITGGSNNTFDITVEYTNALYCPTYYFRIYGKLPEEQEWDLLGEYQEFSSLGTHSFTQTVTTPPLVSNSTHYEVMVVGQDCKDGPCWPTPISYQMKSSAEIPLYDFQIINISIEGTSSKNNPETGNIVTLSANLKGAPYALVSWTVESVGSRLTTSPHGSSKAHQNLPIAPQNTGNPLKYTPNIDTHGAKTVIAKVTWKQANVTCQQEMEKNALLYFKKDGSDYNAFNGDPNWFGYWSLHDDQAVTAEGFDHQNGYFKYDPGYNGWGYTNFQSISLGKQAPLGCGKNGGFFSFPSMGISIDHTGSDCVSLTLGHETTHVDVYNNWLPGGIWNGRPDTDCDGIPDIEEASLQGFDPNSPDSSQGNYFISGSTTVHFLKPDPNHPCAGSRVKSVDGEIYADLKGQVLHSTYSRDWAQPGKQSIPAYRRISQETGNNATFTGLFRDFGLDTNLNQLFDVLTLDAGVDVRSAGNYSFEALLVDQKGQKFGAQPLLIYLEEGNQTIQLSFDGQALRKANVNGTLNATVRLFGDNLEETTTINTGTYQAVQFEWLPAEILGITQETTPDQNTNSLYDSLILSVDVDVHEQGMYTLRGFLADGVSVAEQTATLLPGVSTINLTFAGVSLRASRSNGPYQLGLVSLTNELFTEVDVAYDIYETLAYQYTSFEMPRVEFRSKPLEFGVDLNANRLYDILRLKTTVAVNRSGTYFFSAHLWNKNAIPISLATKTKSLSAGTQSVDLDFNGFAISNSKRHGPYQIVSLTVSDTNGSILNEYPLPINTTSYLYSDFDAFGKISGFTLYNKTPVENVEVSVSGPIITSAQSDVSGRYVIENLPEGTYTLTAYPHPESNLYPTTKTDYFVSSGQERVLNFSLSAAGSVKGKVTDQNGSPVVGIFLYEDVFEPPQYPTNVTGEYIIPYLPAGSTTIKIAEGTWYILVNGEYFGIGDGVLVDILAKNTTIVEFTQQLPANCTDADNDSFFGGCSILPDCDDTDPSIIGLRDDLYLNHNVTLCTDGYSLDDDGTLGIIRFNATGITLNCNGSIIRSIRLEEGTGIYTQKDNSKIEGCTFVNYDVGIGADYAQNISLSLNTLIGNDEGISLYRSDGYIVQNLTLYYNDVSMTIESSDDGLVTKSNFTTNNQGIDLSSSNRVMILSNRFDNVNMDLLIDVYSQQTVVGGNGFFGKGVIDDSGSTNYCAMPNYFAPGANVPYGAQVCGCTDADGDTTYAYNVSCTLGNDCDDTNASIIGLNDDLYINRNSVLCSANYSIKDQGVGGVFILNTSGITLDCNGSSIIGQNQDGYGMYVERKSNITIKGCTFQNYRKGILAESTSNILFLLNTLTGNYQGLSLDNADRFVVQNLTAIGNNYGIDLSYSDSGTITKSEFTNNNYYGIDINSGSQITVLSNYFDNPAVDLFIEAYVERATVGGNGFYGGGIYDDSGSTDYCTQRNYFAPGANVPYDAQICGCTDNDGDGTYAYNISSCIIGNDCDDTNASIIGLKDDFYLNQDVILCRGNYTLEDNVASGILIFNATGITLDCNGSTIKTRDPGDGVGISIYRKGNASVRGCTLSNFAIGISGDSADNISLSSTTIKNFGGSTGVDIDSSSKFSIRNVTVTGDFYTGINIYYSDNGSVIDNTIAGSNDYGTGIELYDVSQIVMKRNNLTGNDVGIGLTVVDRAIIEANEIYGNSEGIDVWYLLTNSRIVNNNLYDNVYYNFVNEDSRDITAENNWWGTTTRGIIVLSIYDYYDDSGLGIVDFEPYLSAPYNPFIKKQECYFENNTITC
ncbi:right-handed parallel beta-helix repeat-containing protein [Candidatus Woesearchaeota archaeon]|nr:right-handed parallel beta-helix repeat-containing protein [Candidatus Woesearchaeota archaeon]